jgi:hypothetical protein
MLPISESRWKLYASAAFSVVGMLVAVSLFLYFIIVAALHHEPLNGQSSWIAALFSFMVCPPLLSSLSSLSSSNGIGLSTDISLFFCF